MQVQMAKIIENQGFLAKKCKAKVDKSVRFTLDVCTK